MRAGNLAQAEAYAAEFVSLDRQLRGDLGDEWYPSGVVAMHLGRAEDARRILSAGIEYSRAIESTIWLAHHFGRSAISSSRRAISPMARDALGPCRRCSARRVSANGRRIPSTPT